MTRLEKGRSTVELPQGRVQYTQEGAGRTILALHGIPGHAGHLKELGQHLGTGAEVIRVNLPGFGGTPARLIPGVSADDMADFLAVFLEALGIESALVVAHSMGGVFAAALAVRHPERVHTVALLGSMGSRPHRSLARSGVPFREISARLERPDEAEAAQAEAQAHFERLRFGRLDPEAVVQTVRIMANMDFSAHAERLRVMRQPTLIAWAQDDPSVEAELAEEIARTVPHGQTYPFEQGGHHLHRTRPAELSDAILAWLYADHAGGRF